MHPRIPRVALAALLAVLWTVPSLARALSPAFEEQRRFLLREQDPAAAERFLADAPLQTRLRAEDDAAYLDLFRAAIDLKDMYELLDPASREIRLIRGGLSRRPTCAFCQEPTRLEAWAGRYRPKRGDDLARALFDWRTMPPSQHAWLAARGVREDAWRSMRFQQRLGRLTDWARPQFLALMRESPRNLPELERYRDRIADIDDYLDHDDSYALGERAEKAEIAISSLAEARSLSAGHRNPQLEAALARAAATPDLDERMAQLARVFDGMNQHRPELASKSPTPAGQGFTPRIRGEVVNRLGPLLLAEVRGTRAGETLRRFYAATPLKITIGGERAGVVATYANDAINFGEDEIGEFLKARGRSASDLVSDQALLRDLVREVAAVFVHEATHHRQDVWRKAEGIPDSFSQYGEIEAMETEAVFALEKFRTDPAYKAYISHSAKTSVNARETQNLARDLAEHGIVPFRNDIRRWYYPEKPSLEAEIGARLDDERADRAPIAKRLTEVEIYDKHRRRFEAVNAETDAYLRQVREENLRAKRRTVVPPPSMRNR